MKKLLSLLAAMALILTLAGCGDKEEKNPDQPKQKVVKVAAIETAYGKGPYEEVAKAFEAETGIKVELTMDKSLEDVIGADMKAGNFPDVIHLAYGRPAALTETFTKENNIRDLENALKVVKIPGEDVTAASKISGGFLDNTFAKPYADGKVYTAPMFYGPCGLFYNQTLLEENGWKVPETWDEMWALGDAAKEKGISLFCYPTAGYFDAFTYGLLNVVGGPEFFNKVTNYEEGIWETAEGQQVLDIIVKLASYTHPTVPANANNDNFKKNQQLVLDGKALFMPNGTWIVGEMADSPRTDGFKWGMAPVPAVKDGGDKYSFTWFEQVWSPKASENQEEADLFISFLYSDKATEIFAKAGAIQPINGVADMLEGDNVLFYSIYDDAKAAMGGFAATDPVEGVNIADAVFNSVNSLVNGEIDKAEYQARIVKASDALRPALKK